MNRESFDGVIEKKCLYNRSLPADETLYAVDDQHSMLQQKARSRTNKKRFNNEV